ncbi:putative nuclease HARBI1 [Anoplophora glabripennis]|uniref:putative nuclease HARBI1 n=1 Tax=Anoplophora glabripennis TaxID=217634 RepID=UPI0008755731|nr:putative nuclease HARBI1 [Anoplophora glabripennis]
MNDYEINAYSSEEELIENEARPRVFRRRPNYFEIYDPQDFFVRFRLKPRTVEMLLEELDEAISHPTERNLALSASQQLLLTLNFFANGSFLRVTGDFQGVSAATASRTVHRVSRAITALRPRYIQMPEGEEIALVRQKFYNIARFPRCIGALDCTHVKIISPGGNNAEVFRNRKQFFSLNVQAITDSNLKIRNIVTRWPGSTHDSYIFRNSNIYAALERGIYGDSLLVGDSGYPVRPYLMTPLHETRNEAEALYNESQIRTRNVVERTFGVWKRRFPALAMGLRLNIGTTQAVVVATAILHNIACNVNENVPPVNAAQEAAIDFIQDIPIINEDEAHQYVGRINDNNRARYNLIYNYFRRL